MSFYYFYKAELPSSFIRNKARSLPAHQTWELARYQIEKRLGIHNKLRQQKANVNHTKVEGYHYSDWKQHGRTNPLQPDYTLQHNDQLVIFRVALPPNVEPYVPASVRQQQQDVEDAYTREKQKAKWMDMTEDERMQDFFQNKQQFMSSSQQPERKGPPPPSYICHRCWVPGHYKSQCPTLSDPNFVPYDKRRRTTGIPMSQLRPARPDEYGDAWLHSDGRLMMPVNQ